LKLANTRCHYDLRKYSFTITDSVDSFKNRLDQIWSNQDILFDYKVDLTGIDNRSLTWMTNTTL